MTNPTPPPASISIPVDLSDTAVFQNTPEWNGNLALSYLHELQAWGSVLGTVRGSYRSEYSMFEFENALVDQTEDYTLLDVDLVWNLQDGRTRIGAARPQPDRRGLQDRRLLLRRAHVRQRREQLLRAAADLHAERRVLVPLIRARGKRSMGAFDVPPPLIPDLIAQHGRWLAGKPALLCGERRFSWREFDRATNRVGNGLLGEGLRPGSRLAVLMHNSAEMVEVLFGAGKAGICVVPLNLSVADDAVAAMIRDSGATAVAASGDQCARIDRLAAAGRLPSSLLRLGVEPPASGWQEFTGWRDRQSPETPESGPSPDAECNIIYSSGTTGLPKGIVHSHACRMHWADGSRASRCATTAARSRCARSACTRTSAGPRCCATVLVGGTLVIMPSFSAERPRRARRAPRRDARRLRAGAVPAPARAARPASSTGSVRCRRSCAAARRCAPTLKRATRDRLGCELIELYGLTEGIITTLAPEDFDRRLESVGKPIPGQPTQADR